MPLKLENKRLCRKCSAKIPNRMRIDGRIRNLKNRKFCLKCSPFREHNTKPDDPARPAKGRRYCDWDEGRKIQHKARMLERGYLRKRDLIKLFGGQCQICSYNKCQRALAFYHRNRSKKKFQLSMDSLWRFSWDKILVEAKKCDLLCVRCGIEREDTQERSKPRSYHHLGLM